MQNLPRQPPGCTHCGHPIPHTSRREKYLQMLVYSSSNHTRWGWGLCQLRGVPYVSKHTWHVLARQQPNKRSAVAEAGCTMGSIDHIKRRALLCTFASTGAQALQPCCGDKWPLFCTAAATPTSLTSACNATTVSCGVALHTSHCHTVTARCCATLEFSSCRPVVCHAMRPPSAVCSPSHLVRHFCSGRPAASHAMRPPATLVRSVYPASLSSWHAAADRAPEWQPTRMGSLMSGNTSATCRQGCGGCGRCAGVKGAASWWQPTRMDSPMRRNTSTTCRQGCGGCGGCAGCGKCGVMVAAHEDGLAHAWEHLHDTRHRWRRLWASSTGA
eukprot:234644-Chlamydomonas_euryale.AAC.9